MKQQFCQVASTIHQCLPVKAHTKWPLAYIIPPQMYLISPRPNVKISHVIHLLVSAVSTWSMVLRVVSFRKALPPSQAEQPVQYSKQVGLNILISSFEGHLPNKSQPFHEPISSVLANKLLEFDCRGLSIPSKHVRSPPASPIPN